MATPHNEANKGDFAKTVLMPGDPLRAKLVAENFLENARCVNTVRNCLGYTGEYKNKPVSVMASGMGMPSIGIYSYELFAFYDVENIIRIGSAGSYSDRLNVLDVVIAESSYSDSTFARYTNGVEDSVIYPDKRINDTALAVAKKLGIDAKLAKVHSTDQFYTSPEMGSWEEIRDRTNSECVEMESFALFNNANMLGKHAACLITISDSFVTAEEISAEDRQKSFTDMIRLALETAIEL
ncbi:MAG: purine-nucleoside phosphorylase [Lachnospiraceae bacterium]|nr:purine-nucleoside phosphorylase [Lachnospiraceae bacterium]